MQQQDVARSETAGELAEHLLGPGADGVEAAAGPAGEAQAETAQHRVEEGAAQSGRRTEEQRVLAGGDRDGVLCALDLRDESSRSEQREIVEMTLTVVFHGVSTPHHLARELRVPLYTLTDAEKGRRGSALLEQIEHSRGNPGIGTIVDGNGDLPPRGRCLRQSRPVGPEERASRRESRGREERMIRDHGAE